jgi:hypothetical protein
VQNPGTSNVKLYSILGGDFAEIRVYLASTRVQNQIYKTLLQSIITAETKTIWAHRLMLVNHCDGLGAQRLQLGHCF